MDARKELEESAQIEFEVTEELTALIGSYSERNGSKVNELQPPYSIVRAMANAAAQVLMAFERGYQMNSED
jgi:hypothetical protein